MTDGPPPLDDMLDQLIACPSVSSVNAELDTGNREVSERLAGWLETLGFRVSLTTVPGHADKCNVIGVLGRRATPAWCWRVTRTPCLTMRDAGPATRLRPRARTAACTVSARPT